MGATLTSCILCRRRADNDPHPTTADSSISTQPCDTVLLPSPVPSLIAIPNGSSASVTLRWSRPISNWSEVRGYEIRYKKLPAGTQLTSHVPRDCETCTLNQDDGIEPLRKYLFSIRPTSDHVDMSIEWTSTSVFIRWYCQFPGCNTDRRRRCNDESISDFCSSHHAREFSTKFCLLPGCCGQRCQDFHFCTKDHLEEATRKGCSGLVPLEQSCKDYADLQKHFSKSWSKKKGQQPQIYSIIKIVNPSFEQRLHEYLSSIPWRYRKIERYYHGTRLNCDLSEYLQSCPDTQCAICCITKKGFDPDRISSNTWQRFGRGFYLAPNSSKSYDYPLAGRLENTALPRRALLVCDVVPGRKYTLHKNDSSLQGPPPGYHSVYGQAKWLLFRTSPDLNYDELVVFNAAAIRPCFILLCENLMD